MCAWPWVVTNAYNFNMIFNSYLNTTAELTLLSVMTCPSDPNMGSIENSPPRHQYNYWSTGGIRPGNRT